MKNSLLFFLFYIPAFYVHAQDYVHTQQEITGKEILRDVTQYSNFSIAASWMSCGPAIVTQTKGQSLFKGISMTGLQVAGYYTTYALPYLGVRTGIVVGEQPLDFQFLIQGATIDSQRIDYSAKQESFFDKEYLFYTGIPLLLEFRLPLSTHFQLSVNSGIQFDYYFPKLAGSRGWIYQGYTGWDSLEMVEVTIQEDNGIPDQKIFASYPVSIGIDYVLPNFNTFTVQLFDILGSAEHFKAPYVIFQGTDDESRGVFAKNSKALGLQVLYTFSGYRRHNRSSSV